MLNCRFGLCIRRLVCWLLCVFVRPHTYVNHVLPVRLDLQHVPCFITVVRTCMHATLASCFRRSKKEKKKEKTRSKSSSASHSCGRSPTVVRDKLSRAGPSKAHSRREGATPTFLELDEWDSRNVQCCVCGCLDSSPDPIFKDRKRIWGYPPVRNKKSGAWTTQGRACYVCTRVQMGCFYPRIKLNEMKAKMGVDQSLHQELASHCVFLALC